MLRSKFQKNKIEKLKDKAIGLHKQGLTTREIGKVLNRSRQWVSNIVKERLTRLDKK